MFEGLDSLKYLYLSKNPVATIQNMAFSELTNIKYLQLATTNLSDTRPDMWKGIPSLKSLFLYNNHNINTLPKGTFKYLPNLKHMSLSETGIKIIGVDMWEGLNNLEDISFTGNDIENFPDGAFSVLDKLSSLYLHRNDLKVIRSDMWKGLDGLTNLDLSANDINSLEPGAFAQLLKLSGLNLMDNDLTTLNQNAFAPQLFNDKHFPHLSLLLRWNPLHCDNRLCCLKEAEDSGWINYQSSWENEPPQCNNYPGVYWLHVKQNFNCTVLT